MTGARWEESAAPLADGGIAQSWKYTASVSRLAEQRARGNHWETVKEAVHSIAEFAPGLRAQALAVIRATKDGGLTDDELYDRSPSIRSDMLRSRRRERMRLGLVRGSGVKWAAPSSPRAIVRVVA